MNVKSIYEQAADWIKLMKNSNNIDYVHYALKTLAAAVKQVAVTIYDGVETELKFIYDNFMTMF